MKHLETDPMVIDRRLIERNIGRGIVSREDYDALCARSPDLTDRCETLAGEPWRAANSETPAAAAASAQESKR